MTCSTSSGGRRPRRLPRRSVDRVRIWPTLTQDRFGRRAEVISTVSGKPAAGSWLVTATAITVPERSLNTSSLRTTTGRRPACSRPRTRSRSAQTMSPLSIRAIVPRSPGTLRLLLVPRPCRAWRTRERDVHGEAAGAFRQERLGSRCCGSGRGRAARAGPLPSGLRGREKRRSLRQARGDGTTKGHTAQAGRPSYGGSPPSPRTVRPGPRIWPPGSGSTSGHQPSGLIGSGQLRWMSSSWSIGWSWRRARRTVESPPQR
jgi:hypothetical protein